MREHTVRVRPAGVALRSVPVLVLVAVYTVPREPVYDLIRGNEGADANEDPGEDHDYAQEGHGFGLPVDQQFGALYRVSSDVATLTWRR